MRVIKEHIKNKETIIQCPECDSIIAYTKNDVMSFGTDDYFGESHCGTEIKCPVCKNMIILNIDDLVKSYPIKIEIKIDEDLRALNSYDFGLKLFQEQVEPELIEGAKHLVIFPKNIEYASILFMEGFKHSLPDFEKTIDVYFHNDENGKMKERFKYMTRKGK